MHVKAPIYKWHKRFCEDLTDVEDDEHSGRPITFFLWLDVLNVLIWLCILNVHHLKHQFGLYEIFCAIQKRRLMT